MGLLALAACSPPEQKHALTRRERTFERLGEVVGRLAPGSTVLVVGNPFAVRSGADSSLRAVEEASVEGLCRGMGKAAVFAGVVRPELKPGALENPRAFEMPPGATTPISFLSAPGAWDRIAGTATRAGGKRLVLVSLVGVPADLAETRAWTDPSGPRWVLYLPDLRLVGSTEALRAAFRERRIAAMVLNRPGAPPESAPPAGDPREDFESRFLLITEENIERTLRDWPQLFVPGGDGAG